MSRKLFTISEAAMIKNVNRTTLHRWIKNEDLKKQEGGLVDLADVERCKSKPLRGRPCGRRTGDSVSDPKESFAVQVAKTYQGEQGLRRLTAMLKESARLSVFNGKGDQFQETLTKTLNELQKEKEAKANYVVDEPEEKKKWKKEQDDFEKWQTEHPDLMATILEKSRLTPIQA
jgi:hypothetical protein